MEMERRIDRYGQIWTQEEFDDISRQFGIRRMYPDANIIKWEEMYCVPPDTTPDQIRVLQYINRHFIIDGIPF